MPSLIDRELRGVWTALQARKPHRSFNLEEVQIRSFRGIKNLRVAFNYPVSVLAGPNGCGKTTVLLTCACAYRQLLPSSMDLTPSILFPDFTDRLRKTLSDDIGRVEFAYYYIDDGQRASMTWRRGKSWNRSFMGHKGGRQPAREVYLRTLANLTNPAEARGALQIMRKTYLTEALAPDLLNFADRILPQRYQRISVISAERRDLLFAEVKDNDEARYSEFHMSSGERTILRMSKDISKLQDALVLIDEIDTGLHPYTQQQLMLELQRLALRQRLQVIVASHSPVVLDSVPPEGRFFLDRDEQTLDVRMLPPHRDIFQKALYGQSREQLSILCEDKVAEGILLGVLDMLQPRLQMRPEDFIIGRSTGRDEFPAHIRALGKFGKLFGFIFVLDGDSRDREKNLSSIAEDYSHSIRPLFLPGEGPPEAWIWQTLTNRVKDYETLLGMSAQDIDGRMREVEQLTAGTLERGNPDKVKVEMFARRLNRDAANLARIVARQETDRDQYEIHELVNGLKDRINLWRKLQ